MVGRMAGDLVRFGVAMDGDLLQRFDEHIGAKGYANRSEALRDLVRADLVNAHLKRDGLAVATLTLDDVTVTGSATGAINMTGAGGSNVAVGVLSATTPGGRPLDNAHKAS